MKQAEELMKYRCTFCSTYCSDPYRRWGVSTVCSEACFNAARDRQRKRSLHNPKRSPTDRPSDPGVTETVRRLVLERDHYACRYCGSVHRLHVHHIVYRSQGGGHVEGNLITLCDEHHALVHADKKRWMNVLIEAIKLTDRRVPQVEGQMLRVLSELSPLHVSGPPSSSAPHNN